MRWTLVVLLAILLRTMPAAAAPADWSPARWANENTLQLTTDRPDEGAYTFPVIRRLVDDIVTVSDAELVEAMKFFASRMKMVVEPTGCLAAAAVFERKIAVSGRKVGILVTGGNVDLIRFAALVREPAA